MNPDAYARWLASLPPDFVAYIREKRARAAEAAGEERPAPAPPTAPETPLDLLRRVYAETMQQYRAALAQAATGDSDARERAKELREELARLVRTGKDLRAGA